MDIRERIHINANICHGKPCIRGLRWPVEVLIDLIGSGMHESDILMEHPELQPEDIQAALFYARETKQSSHPLDFST